MRPAPITIVSITLALALGCERRDPSAGAASNQAPASNTPTWVLAAEPAPAQSITDAKATAAEGDDVVVRGIIGGTRDPITTNSPVFRLVDTGLYNRCTSEDDHCATPWDYCCAPAEDVVTHSATVQLVGTDGTPFAGDPIAAGLSPLDEVIVVGRVGPRPTEDVLTIVTTGVYRVEN